jgi:hypothetical protein
VVISTYNRGALLADALRSVLAQAPDAPPFEVVVVDNNSTDGTRALVAEIARADARVRYVFEGRQGVSYGRNAGVEAARAPLVAFTDDDVRAAPDWVRSIARAFVDHPDADYVGGKVLPMWPRTPPAWITEPEHWSPIAIVDYGDAPQPISLAGFRVLVTANMAIRRAAFLAAGGFDPRHQHLPGAVSAIEDHELQLRLLNRGCRGWYVPSIQTRAEVQARRLSPGYHLRWWFDHGKALARMTPPGFTFDGGWWAAPRHGARQVRARRAALPRARPGGRGGARRPGGAPARWAGRVLPRGARLGVRRVGVVPRHDPVARARRPPVRHPGDGPGRRPRRGTRRGTRRRRRRRRRPATRLSGAGGPARSRPPGAHPFIRITAYIAAAAHVAAVCPSSAPRP